MDRIGLGGAEEFHVVEDAPARRVDAHRLQAHRPGNLERGGVFDLRQPLGLLINFNVPVLKEGIRRVALGDIFKS